MKKEGLSAMVAIAISLIAVPASAQKLHNSSRLAIQDMKARDLPSNNGFGNEVELTRLEARRIAAQAGMVDFDTVKRHGNHIIVEGINENGENLTFKIHRQSGQIVP